MRLIVILFQSCLRADINIIDTFIEFLSKTRGEITFHPTIFSILQSDTTLKILYLL